VVKGAIYAGGMHRGVAWGSEDQQISGYGIKVSSGSYSIHGRPPGGGQVILVPANVPDKFMNASSTQLRQVDIHVSKQFITDWLEE
jgi:hypothetical protein